MMTNQYDIINLHDCRITSIVNSENKIIFHFLEGFNIGTENKTVPNAMIEITNLEKEDIEFYLMKKLPNIKGCSPIYLSKFITLDKIRKILKDKVLEIFRAFYNGNEILWH